MIPETCLDIRDHISDFLDGECAPSALRAVLAHLAQCEPCHDEFERARAVRCALRALPRRRAPQGAALQLRVRLSQELHRNWLGRISIHLENFLQPLLLPASGGVLTALVCLGLLMSAGVPPVSHNPDVPINFSTPARLEELMPVNFNVGDQPVIVVTNVDAEGRATSYKVVSGQNSPKLMHELDRMVYFSLYQPATMFGTPTDGQVVMQVRRITVRG
jgi:putative zinc finger protein